jgi:hypothetical protein
MVHKIKLQPIPEWVRKEKEDLRKDLAEAGYEIKVVNTYGGLNWDTPASKVFELYYVKKGKMVQLNPNRLKELGFDAHWKRKPAENWQFHSGVLGMSRAFEIVSNLSSWLFDDYKKLKAV